MNMLQVLRDEVSTRFKSTEEVNAFMDGFEKRAAVPFVLMDELAKTGLNFGSNVATTAIKAGIDSHLASQIHWGPLAAKAGVGILGGLAAAAIIKSIYAGSGAIANGVLKSKFETALQNVINSNRIIKNADPTKVKSYAATLFSFAPHVASDVNLLNSLLANAVLGEGVDPMTIKTLTELEGKYRDNNDTNNPLPSFKPT